MNMTEYRFGDIVLVPFPFTDQSDIKRRPAVIISSDLYNQKRLDIIIMPVTSQTHSSGFFGDVRLEEWQQAGLFKPSVIKPILTTIEKGLVITKLGHLGIEDLLSLQGMLKTILGK
jgi:mRNA interferase MazF